MTSCQWSADSVFDGAAVDGPGDVYEAVKSAEPADGLRDHGFPLVLVRHVQVHVGRVVALVPHLRGGALALVVLDVGEHDPLATLLQEPPRRLTAKAQLFALYRGSRTCQE